MTVLKPMTKAERQELAKLVRLRAKIAKDEIDQRATRLLADVETQLAASYPANHEAWAEITERAEKSIIAADAEIAHRCRALRIPENFRPRIALSWYGRGENAMGDRRAELRKTPKWSWRPARKPPRFRLTDTLLNSLPTLPRGHSNRPNPGRFSTLCRQLMS